MSKNFPVFPITFVSFCFTAGFVVGLITARAHLNTWAIGVPAGFVIAAFAIWLDTCIASKYKPTDHGGTNVTANNP